MIETIFFIPTLDPDEKLLKLLDKVYEQKYLGDFQIIIIDSDSKKFPYLPNHLQITKKKIERSEFNHGRTRNLAFDFINSKFVVFLSQDAVPVDRYWYTRMKDNFTDEKTVAVYSRQIPFHGCFLPEALFLKERYGKERKVKTIESKLPMFEKIFFSNVSSMFKRLELKDFRFREDLKMCEDQEIAFRLLYKGYSIVYEPKSKVYHSHNSDLISLFKRYFNVGFSFKKINKIHKIRSIEEINSGSFKEVFYQLNYAFIHQGIFPMIQTLSYNMIKALGFILGQNYYYFER